MNNSNYHARGDDSLIVESARVSIDRMTDSIVGNAGKRIYDSTKQLKERNKGIDVLSASLDNNVFYEKLLEDLSDIEIINTRVERDVEFRT